MTSADLALVSCSDSLACGCTVSSLRRLTEGRTNPLRRWRCRYRPTPRRLANSNGDARAKRGQDKTTVLCRLPRPRAHCPRIAHRGARAPAGRAPCQSARPNSPTLVSERGALGRFRSDASQTPHCRLTPKLSCKRSAQYAAHQVARGSISIGGNHKASAAPRACRLQRHVRSQVELSPFAGSLSSGAREASR